MNEVNLIENDAAYQISAGDVLQIGGRYYLVCEFDGDSYDIYSLESGQSPWVAPVYKEQLETQMQELYGKDWVYLGKCKIQIMKI